MDNSKLKKMVKSHYQGVFNDPWGETWYSNVIDPIVLSVERNEKLREENENSFPILSEAEYQPYELIIETQVGLVLLLCQSYITNVVSKITSFHSDAIQLLGFDLTGFSTKRSVLIAMHSSKYKNTSFTEIQAIEHLANYFKHHEEWQGKVEPLKNNAKRTADAVKELGLDINMSLWFSRNLSKAIKNLGVGEPRDLSNILKIIDDWKIKIGLVYEEAGLFDE